MGLALTCCQTKTRGPCWPYITTVYYDSGPNGFLTLSKTSQCLYIRPCIRVCLDHKFYYTYEWISKYFGKNVIFNDEKFHLKLIQVGQQLTPSLIHHFETDPNSKKLQMTTEMLLLKDFKILITWKTSWKKVKWLILNNFAFFHDVFLRYFLQCVKTRIYGEKAE